MANYIKQSLEEGETIIFKGRLHWSYIFGYIFSSLLLLGIGIAVLWVAYKQQTEQRSVLFYAGIAFLVLAFLTWLVGWPASRP